MIDIVKHTNLYARQKNNHTFHVNLDEIKGFIGILILSGYHSLPRKHMYWEKTMTYKRFKEIKKYLHFNDNELENDDKLFKLRPMINRLNLNFKK